MTARSTCPGQRGRRRQAGNAVQFGRGRIDRVDRAGEAAGHDAAQDDPPDRAEPPARADDGDRGRRQDVPQAGHVGRPFPLGHRVPVGAEGGVGLAGGQRERKVVHTVREGAVHLQPGVGEHPQHGRVLAQRVRGNGAAPAAAGHRDQVLQQQRADAAGMHVVGDREGDLGRPGPGIVALEGAAADQLAAQHGEQRDVVRPGLAADPACLPFGRHRAQAEEAQVEVVRGHLGVQVPHRVEVLGPGGPDLDRRAVGQQSVGAGLARCAHVGLPRVLQWLAMSDLTRITGFVSLVGGHQRADPLRFANRELTPARAGMTVAAPSWAAIYGGVFRLRL